MDRREFLEKSGAVVAGTSGVLGLPLLTSCSTENASSGGPTAGRRWGMVIDLSKCSDDCTVCLDACRNENNVAFHGDERWDIHWIRKVNVSNRDPDDHAEKSVLLSRISELPSIRCRVAPVILAP